MDTEDEVPAGLLFPEPFLTAKPSNAGKRQLSCTGGISAGLNLGLGKGENSCALTRNTWPAEMYLHFSPLLPLLHQV